MAHYQRVAWHHERDDEPSTLWSEVDDAGYEIRKIEVYRDGHADTASDPRWTGSTMLSETALPSAAEIGLQMEFTVSIVSREQFEAVWRRHTSSQT